MTKKFRKELFSEFLAPLAIVLAIFSLAAFWPIGEAGTQSAAAVEVAMPLALSGHDGQLKDVPAKPATQGDRRVTTIDRPAAVMQGRS